MKIGPAGVPPSKFVISPLSGNIGIDSGHESYVTLSSHKVAETTCIKILIPLASIFHNKGSCTEKTFPSSRVRQASCSYT